MGPLKTSSLLAAIIWSVPASAAPTDQWEPLVREAGERFRVPADWIRRVMKAESGGRTVSGGRPIVSSAGAMGLMQLMPATWAEMRSAYRLGPDPHRPRDNIFAGAAYLRLMYDRFGFPGLFAAYNAGPARYARHLLDGRGLPAETVRYVAKITGRRSVPSSRAPRLASAVPTQPETLRDGAHSLFVRLRPEVLREGVADGVGSPVTPATLFVPLRSAAGSEDQAPASTLVGGRG